MAIDYRELGATGVKVSPLCLGAMMFGAWGNTDHEDSARIIHRALDAGINFIDTADVYSRGESAASGAGGCGARGSPGAGATRSCWRARCTARWARTPTNTATRGAGSCARWRTAC